MPGVMQAFQCNEAVSALGLSLFVAGYGLGPWYGISLAVFRNADIDF